MPHLQITSLVKMANYCVSIRVEQPREASSKITVGYGESELSS